MIAQKADPTNGGAAGDSASSSSHIAVAEECTDPPANSTCGRGEFGYGGGELPFSAVTLNSLDTEANGESFQCPGDATTKTGTGGGTTPPEVLFFPGNLQGGNQGKGSNFTGETECFSPYTTGSSQATGASARGKAYSAATAPISGGLNATWFVPNTSGSGGSCAGQVLQAGGDAGTASTSAANLYNPNANLAGFNSWSALPTPPTGYQSSMVAARDTPGEVQLDSVPNAPSGDTQLLLIGGEATLPAGQYNVLNSYEIFDANKCGFLTGAAGGTLSSARFDFGAARFASGHVLACGGADDLAFDFSSTCDLFVPNASLPGGGTWYPAVATLSRPRAGDFAALIAASINKNTLVSNILVAGGSSSGGATGTFAADPTSDVCTETNPSATPPTVSCALDSARYDSNPSDLGFTPQTSIGAEDASHVTIGCNPAEGYVGAPGPGNPNTTTECNGIAKLAGETENSTYDGLILACGGFAGGANSSGGNDTQIECEYYVPSGRSVSGAGLSCSNGTSGPTWCVKTGLLMNRERAYFNLSEVLAGQAGTNPSVSNSFWILGGFYGEPPNNASQYLVRKNVEFRNKGS